MEPVITYLGKSINRVVPGYIVHRLSGPIFDSVSVTRLRKLGLHGITIKNDRE